MSNFSIIQSSARRFAIIKGTVSLAGYPLGYQGKDWDYLKHEGRRVLDDISINDAREICAKLNDGSDVSAFFEGHGGGYGCDEHQAFGDQWLGLCF